MWSHLESQLFGATTRESPDSDRVSSSSTARQSLRGGKMAELPGVYRCSTHTTSASRSTGFRPIPDHL